MNVFNRQPALASNATLGCLYFSASLQVENASEELVLNLSTMFTLWMRRECLDPGQAFLHKMNTFFLCGYHTKQYRPQTIKGNYERKAVMQAVFS